MPPTSSPPGSDATTAGLAGLSASIAVRVRRLAQRLCGRDAEDACQEVHREVTAALPGFRGEAAPTTWAHKIAVRTIARFAKRRRRQADREPRAGELGQVLDADAVADFRDEPFTLLVAAERAQRVRRAIDALSPPLRDVLVLRALEEMSYAQIADALELPLGTVKSRIAAATLRLAERLQVDGEQA